MEVSVQRVSPASTRRAPTVPRARIVVQRRTRLRSVRAHWRRARRVLRMRTRRSRVRSLPLVLVMLGSPARMAGRAQHVLLESTRRVPAVTCARIVVQGRTRMRSVRALCRRAWLVIRMRTRRSRARRLLLVCAMQASPARTAGRAQRASQVFTKSSQAAPCVSTAWREHGPVRQVQQAQVRAYLAARAASHQPEARLSRRANLTVPPGQRDLQVRARLASPARTRRAPGAPRAPTAARGRSR